MVRVLKARGWIGWVPVRGIVAVRKFVQKGFRKLGVRTAVAGKMVVRKTVVQKVPRRVFVRKAVVPQVVVQYYEGK